MSDCPSPLEIVFPAQPYYLPGYMGYSPQSKYRIGKSRSQLSHILFADPTVAHSGKSVLSGVTLRSNDEPSPEIQCPCENNGCIFSPPLNAGYQGVFPREKLHIGMNRTRCQTSALADFNPLRQERKHFYDCMRKVESQPKPIPLMTVTPKMAVKIKENMC